MTTSIYNNPYILLFIAGTVILVAVFGTINIRLNKGTKEIFASFFNVNVLKNFLLGLLVYICFTGMFVISLYVFDVSYIKAPFAGIAAVLLYIAKNCLSSSEFNALDTKNINTFIFIFLYASLLCCVIYCITHNLYVSYKTIILFFSFSLPVFFTSFSLPAFFTQEGHLENSPYLIGEKKNYGLSNHMDNNSGQAGSSSRDESTLSGGFRGPGDIDILNPEVEESNPEIEESNPEVEESTRDKINRLCRAETAATTLEERQNIRNKINKYRRHLRLELKHDPEFRDQLDRKNDQQRAKRAEKKLANNPSSQSGSKPGTSG